MNRLKLANYKHIHFIGIGGISMSGLAEILHSKKYRISGSDSKASDLTAHLSELGIDVKIGQSADNITEEIELVVYTAAVKDSNPELAAALKRKIPAIDRAELLGILMSEYQYPICISGTHGKTTTTSMISEIFLTAGKMPTITIGGMLQSIHSNIYVGGNKYFIAESCEYFDSFLKFYPYVGIILNVDFDHLDYFKNMSQVVSSYRSFAENISENGVLVINNAIGDKQEITKNLKCRIISYGKGGDFTAERITYDSAGHGSFDCFYNGRFLKHISLNLIGEHNISNALAAIASSYSLGINEHIIESAFKGFNGTDRRFQIKGNFNGVTIADDYAHHPTEIKATLSASKKTDYKEVWCVFQPHTFTRTRELLSELSKSFAMADHILILDIYAAREKDTGEIHSKTLTAEIMKHDKKAIYFPSFETVTDFLIDNCKPGDLLITMGAGDVYLVGEKILQRFYPHYPQTYCV